MAFTHVKRTNIFLSGMAGHANTSVINESSARAETVNIFCFDFIGILSCKNCFTTLSQSWVSGPLTKVEFQVVVNSALE